MMSFTRRGQYSSRPFYYHLSIRDCIHPKCRLTLAEATNLAAEIPIGNLFILKYIYTVDGWVDRFVSQARFNHDEDIKLPVHNRETLFQIFFRPSLTRLINSDSVRANHCGVKYFTNLCLH